MPDADVQITLTRGQVAEIVSSTSAGESPLMLLRGMANASAVLARADGVQLSRSLLRGFVVLASLPRDRAPLGVVEIAGSVGVSTSTTHRYLQTLVELGLVERDADSRRYRLAGLAADASDGGGASPAG